MRLHPDFIAPLVELTADPLLRSAMRLFACEPAAALDLPDGRTATVPLRAGPGFAGDGQMRIL